MIVKSQVMLTPFCLYQTKGQKDEFSCFYFSIMYVRGIFLNLSLAAVGIK